MAKNKKQRREKTKTHLKGRRQRKTGAVMIMFTILALFLMVVLTVDPISAADWDNHKKVKDTFGKAGYKDIEIENLFGIGEKLWSGTLESNTETCWKDCEAIQTIELHKKGVLIDDVIFKTLQGENGINSYQIHVKTEVEEYEVNDYEYRCIDKLIECDYFLVGKHTEYTNEWQPYILGTELEKGIYEVKLTGKKSPSTTVDWIYKTQGVQLDEWAIWGNISAGAEAEVFLFDFDNDIIEDEPASFNCSANITKAGVFISNLSFWHNGTGTFERNQTLFLVPKTVEAHGVTYTSTTGSHSTNYGLKIKTGGRGFNIIKIGRDTSSTQPQALILDASKSPIANSTWVGDEAQFNFTLEANTEYYLVQNGTGVSRSVGAGFPYAGTYLNFTGALEAGSDTTVNLFDIVNITLGEETSFKNNLFTIPVSGNPLLWSCSASDDENVEGFAIQNLTETFRIVINNKTFNSSTFETAKESLSVNVTANSSLTAVNLYFNGTKYTTTKNSDTWITSFDIPLGGNTNKTFNWEFIHAGDSLNSSNNNISISDTNFSLCGTGGGTTPYLNFTFKDESDDSTINNGTIPSSTWLYYLGTGTTNKTFTFINNTANPSYAFCATPADRNLTIDYSLQYEDQEGNYIQRLLNPDALSFSNATTNTTLYLLKSTDGIYVTFQVINTAEQAISGVVVTGTRVISSETVTVASGVTDAAGAVTFFLDSDFEHTFTFVATGYDTITQNIFPTQSSYTITLGGTTTPIDDYNRQITININPTNTSLLNDTAYDFDFILDSDFWEVTEFGFVLFNSSGSSVASNSVSANGGTATTNYNVGNTTSYIQMNYYYVISGNYTNSTHTWYVLSSAGTDWSISNFFTDFTTYVGTGEGTGIFGIGKFGRGILVFLIVFVFVGIMSYKFGLVSPAGIATLVFGLVLFFDVGVGMIPNPVGAVNNFPTIIMGLILLGIMFREVWR